MSLSGRRVQRYWLILVVAVVAGGAALICRLLDKTATAEASVALTS